jgi:Flp pilus assembly pilin Flp
MLSDLYRDEGGLTTVEYALLLALLVVAAIGVWTGFGTKLKVQVSKSNNAFSTASNA